MAIADVALIGLDRSVTATLFLAEMLKRYGNDPDVSMELGGMGTTLEGATDAVWKRIAEMHELLFEMGLDNTYTIVKMHDYRKPGEETLTSAGKIAQVEAIM